MSGPDGAPLCALPALLPLAAARRVLVLAPHPDDECIGCGGLLLRLREQGTPAKVVLVSDGGGAGGLPPGAAALRQQEFRNALQVLGVADGGELGFVDGTLVADQALIETITSATRGFSPNWLLAPSSADAHRDHRAVSRAARQAALAVPTVEYLIEYETWSPLPASHVLDIGAQLPRKMAALAEHRTALQHGNYLEATEGLARYRSLLLGAPRAEGAAEAFLVLERSTGFNWPEGLGRP